MQILNFFIAIVALIIAIAAFQRTGGIKDLKKNTAELLARVEKRMREEKPGVDEEKKQQERYIASTNFTPASAAAGRSTFNWSGTV